MSIDRKLLELLVCPVTKQPVFELSQSKLETLNQKITAGEVTNHAGDKITVALQSALVTRNGETLYPVTDNIPVMLEDQSIATIQLGDW